MVNNTVDQYSLRDKIVLGVLKVLVGFVIFALITQLYFVYCEIFKSPEEN
jgi:hypothetical protein